MRRLLPAIVVACGPSPTERPIDAAPPADACSVRCSDDQRAVLCGDAVRETCSDVTVCDLTAAACVNACTLAEQAQSSIGCDYYATSMDVFRHGNCFAAFVANTWPAPAHLTVRRDGVALPVAAFTRIPSGSGANLVLDAYDEAAGLAPGEVAVVFLGGDQGATPKCPIASAAAVSSFVGSGIGSAFEIVTDVPTVAYQINPFGGGVAAQFTGAALLLPTSVWHTSYIAVNSGPGVPASADQNPSFNIVARDDNTVVTIVPPAAVAIAGGNGIPSGGTGAPVQVTLAKGQHAQLTQEAELTGSIVTADKPIGVMAGHQCIKIPAGTNFCDHTEQQVPPVRALGRRYAAVMYRPRVAAETATTWRVVGAVDGTQLTYSAAVGGPQAIGRGEAITFETGTPFEVTSQDADHPFMLFAYMSSAAHVQTSPQTGGFGDPDFVLAVPPEQWLARYVFFTDPTYPETALVVVRARGPDAQFHDVSLDCAGALTGWQAITTDLEFARVDLSTGNFAGVGACDNGRHEMTSAAPFGLTVWAWGTRTSTPSTANVSYGYPGGMNVAPINNVIL